MNVAEKVAQIKSGKLSSVKLCEEAIRRIEKNDQKGHKLNAVCAINPHWYEEAKALDENPNKADSAKLLYGIPLLVKDNIEVKDMANSAGSYVLKDYISIEDSFLIGKLRKEGAVILGKCNLSEFAYWMSEDGMPSGYSSLSGQVVHPYNPEFDPSGSSSGSAVAAAARYTDITIGTETDGSLMSPAISNGIVSLKPTVGLVSRDGIIPISEVQDTAGPMANCVEDCVLALQAMAAIDQNDPYSANAKVNDYLKELKADLSGKKIGVFTIRDGKYDAAYLRFLKDTIRKYGGVVCEFEYEDALVDEYPCLFYEFRNGINAYLEKRAYQARNLKDIIRMNEENKERCLKHGQSLLIKSEECSGDLNDPEYRRLRKTADEKAHELLDKLIDDQGLSCIVTVSSTTPANLAAVGGTCSMVIPAKKPDEEKYDPLSFYLMGKANQEGELIRLAYTLEKELNIVSKPSWL